MVQDPEKVLQHLNQRLSELINERPLTLSYGGGASLQDSLWVWGVIGGKDVGKSTLINALADAPVVDLGDKLGEGTFCPAAYLTASDLTSLQARFATRNGQQVRYLDRAPESMRGLVLVDLPDVDSIFADHVEQVRSFSHVLDGIIWMTTPKKVGDLQALREVRNLLKDRLNFLFVVNKVDWLLAQESGDAASALQRIDQALRDQIAAIEGDMKDSRTYLVSALHPTGDKIVRAVAQSRGVQDPDALDAALRVAAQEAESQFVSLRQTLTAAPTAEAATSHKQANLRYQVGRQAKQLAEYYRPRELSNRLEQELGRSELSDMVFASFPPAYGRQVLQQLLGETQLWRQWAGTVFEHRLRFWSLLGVVVWPATAMASGWRAVLQRLPGTQGRSDRDPFRQDGIELSERAQRVIDGVYAALGRIGRPISVNIPEPQNLKDHYEQDLLHVAESIRTEGIRPLLERRPSWIGRFVRWCVPWFVLMWFPFVQPLLEAGLAASLGSFDLTLESVLLVVRALSANHVLVGLSVSVLVLALMAAGVYAASVRTAQRIAEKINAPDPTDQIPVFSESILQEVSTPIEEVVQQLQAAADQLDSCLTTSK